LPARRDSSTLVTMSYVHCPGCGRAFDLARQAACARCSCPGDEVADAVQRLARATPVELAAAAERLGAAWSSAVAGAWIRLRAEPELQVAPAKPMMLMPPGELRTRREVMRPEPEAPPVVEVVEVMDTTALDAIQITYDVERPSTAIGRLAARGDRAIARVAPMIARAGTWSVGRARALLARFR
jgi:hypothetical protein